MSGRFGEELSLDEVLSLRTNQEKEHDRFVNSAPGSNFGPELTLDQVIEILHYTALPARATFWEKNDPVVRNAIKNHDTHVEIGDFEFKIEYFARIKSVRKYEFSAPLLYTQFYPNGKGTEHDDSQSGNSDSSTTGSSGNTDV